RGSPKVRQTTGEPLFFCMSAIRITGRLVTYTIWVLLFILGTVIDSNELIIYNFSILGGQAFLLALAGVT
ncbi:MAG: hypothetical protein LUG51_15005, partial [Tannerellaceae bacterium]|nr:hypothetical protein [Tannerellaceae bacterium]